ncbi:MAG TPA: type II toxin-antitoxin system VapC family toxin [Solirubrobacteraceae bacterium]|nr:type II toxin-antitoxin system VapC family toxin [Solirubrobacteraceae bacterium]
MAALVVDASALVEALVGSELGAAVGTRMRGCELHAPAHVDAEVLSALRQLHGAGELSADAVTTALGALETAPIARHPLVDLLAGAWRARNRFRLVDALYVELAEKLTAVLLTADVGLAQASPIAELVSE